MHYEIEYLDAAGIYGPRHAWAVLKLPVDLDDPHGRWKPQQFATRQEAEAEARFLREHASASALSRIVRVDGDRREEVG